ncbi:hypothetical protein B0H15DRAFT_546662 [Mycena belliarum]|uniref:TLC domain-containing protein n=1 Tax=Mycena belliarum TaxID=1033014 RepID=A0AAD6XZL2_9AGAR|nr:hypothetical protein B0H15DRAFT_546662 [Mycena belliae]
MSQWYQPLLNSTHSLSMTAPETARATTVAFYPVPAVLFFLSLYVSGKFTELILSRYSIEFPKLSFEHRRNTVAYCLSTLWTTVALVLQLCASPLLAEKYTFDRIDLVKLAGLVISGLYIWELIYRASLRLPILIHHFCTLFATILIIATLQETHHAALSSLGLLWIFHASTEQSIFIGLIMYRLRCPKRLVQNFLYFSAVQSFLFKSAFSVYLYIWWGLKLAGNSERAIDVAFSVLFVLTLTCLVVTQGYGSWAAWSIARRMAIVKEDKEASNDAQCDSERTTITGG